MDDDGLDDYVYVNEDGAVAYFKNTGVAGADRNPEWGLAHLVADGVGVAPRDLQFANTDGEGAVDYVVVGRITGKATTWHNLGFRTDGSQSIRWNTPLPFADGTDPVNPGHTIQLADVSYSLFTGCPPVLILCVSKMTGDGRADYVAIDPDTGSLTLWQNRCWETGDGDDGDGGGGGGGDDGPDPDKKPWDDRSHWEWCNITDQKGFSQEQKTYVWGSEGKGLGVGQWLDEQISGFDGEDQWEKQIDWLNTLVGHHKNINNSEAWNHWECKDIYDNTNCISNSFDCTDFYDADLPQLYWIAEATASLNSYVMGMALRLSDTTLKNRLEIDTSKSAFPMFFY